MVTLYFTLWKNSLKNRPERHNKDKYIDIQSDARGVKVDNPCKTIVIKRQIKMDLNTGPRNSVHENKKKKKTKNENNTNFYNEIDVNICMQQNFEA